MAGRLVKLVETGPVELQGGPVGCRSRRRPSRGRRAPRQLPRPRSGSTAPRPLRRCGRSDPPRDSGAASGAPRARPDVGRPQRCDGIRQLELFVDLDAALLDRPLGLLVFALGEVVVAEHSLPVPQIKRGPDLVAVLAPDLEVGVMRDRELDAEPGDRGVEVSGSPPNRTEGNERPGSQARCLGIGGAIREDRAALAGSSASSSPRTRPAERGGPSSVPTRTKRALIHSMSGGNSGTEMSRRGGRTAQRTLPRISAPRSSPEFRPRPPLRGPRAHRAGRRRG